MNFKEELQRESQNTNRTKLNFTGLPVQLNELKFAPSLSRRDFDKQNRIFSKEKMLKKNYQSVENKRKFQTNSKYLEDLNKRKIELASRLNQIKNIEENNHEKLRDFEFLNLNLEKHVYKLPFPKIVVPITKKKMKSNAEKLEPEKYSRINMDQDEYTKLMSIRKEKNSQKIKSNYFHAMNQSIKDRKPKAFNLNKDNKEHIINIESEIANISQSISLTDVSKKLYKQSPVYTHTQKNISYRRNKDIKIVKEIQYNANILYLGENSTRSKVKI